MQFNIVGRARLEVGSQIIDRVTISLSSVERIGWNHLPTGGPGLGEGGVVELGSGSGSHALVLFVVHRDGTPERFPPTRKRHRGDRVARTKSPLATETPARPASVPATPTLIPHRGPEGETLGVER